MCSLKLDERRRRPSRRCCARTRAHAPFAVGGFSPSAELRPGQDPFEHVFVSFPPADLRVLLGHFLIEGWVRPRRSRG